MEQHNNQGFKIYLDEMARLENQWPNFYSPERKSIIYGWVRGLSYEWFRKTVTQFLGSQITPPLKEIQIAASLEKERLRSLDKYKHKADAKIFWTAMPDEVKQKIGKLFGKWP